MSEETFWNGEPAPCRRVLVRVGSCDKPTYWYNGLEGTERHAVEVTYGDSVFLIDDDNGEGTPEPSPHAELLMAEMRKSHPEAYERHQANRAGGKGAGWLKVTAGRGAPFGPNTWFRSLPSDSVVLRELTLDDFTDP